MNRNDGVNLHDDPIVMHMVYNAQGVPLWQFLPQKALTGLRGQELVGT